MIAGWVCALVCALGNLAGGAAAARGARGGLKAIETMLAFGAGFMLAVALLEILPESLARGGPRAAGYVLAGYLLVHLSQHTMTEHFHFGEETHRVRALAGPTALVGLLLHTLFDGVAVASGFAVSTQLGLLVFLAVLSHKLPEGVTIASLFLAGGRPAGQAIGAAGLLGLATVAGVWLTGRLAFLGSHGLALSAGVTIYVGASNLVPEFQGKPGWRLPAAFFLGAVASVGAMALLARAGG